ncbi:MULTISPECIES: caspase family protein [unclassified Microcoleus]|uniref:caspase family protein n=1 Tax=unclassified Microcoleus TaxID=2642155 RepID=UPI0025F1955E|nr:MULTISPECIES: caspase family protein [unclassified Microcoleus]
MSNKFSHGYALLIGIGDSASYSNWSLPVTVKDIQELQSILIDPSFCAYLNDDVHMRLLSNAGATRGAILDGLTWIKKQAATDSEATVIVYYSGHGWLDESTGQYYLIPHDIEPFDIANSALSAQIFTEALREIQAHRLLVIIDSCRAEGMATAKNEQATTKLPSSFVQTAFPKKLIDELKQGEGRAVFTSSRGTQSSWIRSDRAMSIYTYHLIEALRGAGSQPGETVVRISHIMNHVGKTVPQSAHSMKVEQTPFFDFATEDFAVALLRGGKGLPKDGWDAVEAEAAETISAMMPGRDTITISGNQEVDQSGSGNINLGNIGQARDITLGSKTQAKD